MSFEAIKSISEAEELARQAKADAQANAKKEVDYAKVSGKAAIDAAVKRAEEEIKVLIHASDEKAAEKAVELNENTANQCAAMRAHAEGKLNMAAKLIVERIVNS